MHRTFIAALVATVLPALVLAPAFAADAPANAPKKAVASRFAQDPYASTYRAIASPPVLIQGATVLTGTGTRLDGADVLMHK